MGAMIPFYTGRFFGALADRYGFVFAEKDGLRLTFHEGDTDTKPPETDVDSVLIPWLQVRGLEVRRRLTESHLVVRVSSTHTLVGLPVTEENEVTLQIQRKHRDGLDAFLARAGELRSGQGGKSDVDAALGDIKDFIDRI
jgi:hypothetical protein